MFFPQHTISGVYASGGAVNADSFKFSFSYIAGNQKIQFKGDDIQNITNAGIIYREGTSELDNLTGSSSSNDKIPFELSSLSDEKMRLNADSVYLFIDFKNATNANLWYVDTYNAAIDVKLIASITGDPINIGAFSFDVGG